MFLYPSWDIEVCMGGQLDGKNLVEMITLTGQQWAGYTLNACDKWSAFRNLIFRLILLKTFIHYLEKAMTCPFMKLADDRRLVGGYHLRAGLPFRGTQTSWRNRLTGTSQNSARTNAKPCPWKRRCLCSDTGWGQTGWGAAVWKRPWRSSWAECWA